MPSHPLARLILRTVVWAAAASTWASIAHHLFGFPDVGLALVTLTCFAVVMQHAHRQRTHGRAMQPALTLKSGRAASS